MKNLDPPDDDPPARAPDSAAPGGAAPPPRPQAIVDAALERILNDPSLAPGSRLPTERALAQQLSVRRSAVRAALARLEAKNRVVRIIGSGTYVAEPDSAAASPAGDVSPAEILETRLMIEPRLAGPVVAHANGADLDRIDQAMARARAAADFHEFEMWDGLLHQAIADATHNRLLNDIYRVVSEAREQTNWGELKRLSFSEERRQVYNHEHAEIVAALRARNAQRAEAAIRQHLISVRHNLGL
jgi:DNA-binding FadR family transcriptional regulator